MKSILIFLLFVITAGLVTGQTEKAPKPIAPYSPVVKAGNTYYLAGQIPIDSKTGELFQGDIRIATRIVMENMGAILKQNGLDYSNIVKCTVYLKNLDHYQAMNEVYGSFFDGRYPARVAVQVARLPLDADIEIASIAVKE